MFKISCSTRLSTALAAVGLLLLGAVLATGTAQAQDEIYRVVLTVSDDERSAELIMGMRADATDGFDPGLDSAAVPRGPVPVLDARITNGGDLPIGTFFTDLIADYRSVSALQYYALEYTPGGGQGAVVLTWDPAELVGITGDARLADDPDPDQATLSIDLKSQNSFETQGTVLAGGGYVIFELPEFIPVELSAFEGFAEGDAVALRWRTASETNNAGFHVERQEGGAWQDVAFVAGHGTTTEEQRYVLRLDGQEPGTHRFRLRQVDFDGTAEYSDAVEVTVALDGRFRLGGVHPNPARSAAELALTVERTQVVRAALYDALGRRVAIVHDGLVEAGRTVTLRVEGRDLPAGLYVVRVEGEAFRAAETVTILR